MSHPSFINDSSQANGHSQLPNTFSEAPGSWALVRLKFVKIGPKLRAYGQFENKGADFKSTKINQKWATFENMELAENLISQGYNFTNFGPILQLYMSNFSEDQAL